MSALGNYLERKAESMAARRADYAATPGKSVARIVATSKVAGITGARPTQVGAFSFVTDSGPGLAGHALGPTAPELLMGALASCLVHTYLIQAVLLSLPLDHVEIEVSGSLDYAGVVGLPVPQQPQLTDMSYRARVESSASAADVERLHAAVEESCPVLNTLRNPITVTRAQG